MPRAYLYPPGQTQPGSADDEKLYLISPHVRLGLSRCQPLSACVCVCEWVGVYVHPRMRARCCQYDLSVFVGGGRWVGEAEVFFLM